MDLEFLFYIVILICFAIILAISFRRDNTTTVASIVGLVLTLLLLFGRV